MATEQETGGLQEKTNLQKDTGKEKEVEVEVVVEGEGGDKEENKKTEPPQGHKRFNEVYGKMKTYERETGTLKDDLTKANETIELLRGHNDTLENINKSSIDSRIEDVDGEIKNLQSQRDKALDDQELTQAEKIKDKLQEARDKKKSLLKQSESDSGPKSFDMSQFEEKGSPGKSKEEEGLLEMQAEMAKAEASFTEETPWYDKKSESYDDVLARAVEGVDKSLLAKEEWRDMPPLERHREARRIVEDRFKIESTVPLKGDGDGEGLGGGIPSVGSVSSSGGSPGEKVTVSLSAKERRRSHMMFSNLPPEEAEKKMALQLYNKRKSEGTL